VLCENTTERSHIKTNLLKQLPFIFDYSDEEKKQKKDNLFNYLAKENIALHTPQIEMGNSKGFR
jgi:hypothetical protein